MRDSMHQAHRFHQTNSKAGAVLVRPVSPGDEEGLRGMLSRLSRESIYLRFHAPYPRVPEWVVTAFVDANRRDGESLVAVAKGEIVGHAMYVRAGGEGEAEFAVLVEDRWQGRGVGKLLLSALAERASERGVQTFTGAVLGENRRMLGLARSVFAGVGYAVEDGAYQVSAPLRSFDSPAGSLGLSA